MTGPSAAGSHGGGLSGNGLDVDGLRVDGLSIRIGRATIVDDLSFTAPAGAVTALVGPNGAGKSTLLRATIGALRPDAGTIHFDGADLLRMPRGDRARTVALVEQQAGTDLDLGVTDVVGLGRIPHQGRWHTSGPDDEALISSALVAAGAAHLIDRRYASLSGGEKQRVRLAAALAQEPRLLLVDEPTNHLDIGAQLDTLALLRRLADAGLTVVTALHDLGHALAHADHVVAMADGRAVATGDPDTVLSPTLIHELYGVHAHIVAHPETGAALLAFQPR